MFRLCLISDKERETESENIGFTNFENNTLSFELNHLLLLTLNDPMS